MRFDTINASNHLVRQMEGRGLAQYIRDDEDLILVRLHDGKEVMIYLFDRPVSLQEMTDIYQQNTADNRYTVMVFWVEMLLPAHDSRYVMDDWMEALVPLHGGMIWGFAIAGRRPHIVPVLFNGEGLQRRIVHGYSLVLAQIKTERRMTRINGREVWFNVAQLVHETDVTQPDPDEHVLMPFYRILGIRYTEDMSAIKSAYYQKARELHPDVSDDDSGDAMKLVNEAYQRILGYWETD